MSTIEIVTLLPFRAAALDMQRVPAPAAMAEFAAHGCREDRASPPSMEELSVSRVADIGTAHSRRICL